MHLGFSIFVQLEAAPLAANELRKNSSEGCCPSFSETVFFSPPAHSQGESEKKAPPGTPVMIGSAGRQGARYDLRRQRRLCNVVGVIVEKFASLRNRTHRGVITSHFERELGAREAPLKIACHQGGGWPPISCSYRRLAGNKQSYTAFLPPAHLDHSRSTFLFGRALQPPQSIFGAFS